MIIKMVLYFLRAQKSLSKIIRNFENLGTDHMDKLFMITWWIIETLINFYPIFLKINLDLKFKYFRVDYSKRELSIGIFN